MPKEEVKIRIVAYYDTQRFSRVYDLLECRKKGQNTWKLAHIILYDFLGPEILGTPLTFDAKESGLGFLLAMFLANRLIKGEFTPMNGTVKLNIKVKIPVSLRPAEDHSEHVT